MKITKRQLKRIIKEYNPRLDPGYDPLDTDEFAHESPEDDADYDRGLEAGFAGWPRDSEASDAYHTGYDQGEMDAKDPDSEMSIDYAESMASMREDKLKITKRQLRRIIREERNKLIREQPAEEKVTTDVETDVETDAVGGLSGLKTWFVSQKDTIGDAGIKTTNIPALVAIIEALISAAAAGDLKSKETSLTNLIKKIGGLK